MPKDKEWKDLSFEERTREMGKTEKGRKILEEGKLQSDENEEMRLRGELYSSGQFADEEEGGYVGDINESDYSPDDEYEEDGDYEGEIDLSYEIIEKFPFESIGYESLAIS